MQRKIRLALALLVALTASLLSGCHKKKPQIVPPQAQAPTTSTPAPVQPQPSPSVPQTPATTAPAPSTTPQQQTATTPKPKPKRTTHVGKSAPTEQEKAATKKVVPAGNTDNTVADISVGMNQAEATHERETTEKLLQSTEANLNGLNRALSSDEAAMVEEVRNYMAQARQAMNDGDLIRANNLAMKAHLLSDALVKH